MISAADLKPYVDLLTWQVVAILGGIFLVPAVYVLVLRMEEGSLLGVHAKLGRRRIAEVDKEEESDAETSDEDVVAEPAAVLTEQMDKIEDLSGGEAESSEERYREIVKAYLALAAVVRSIALPHGGASNLKKFGHNLALLREKKLLPSIEIARLDTLGRLRWKFQSDPASLTVNEHRSYLNKAKRLINRIHAAKGEMLEPTLDL